MPKNILGLLFILVLMAGALHGARTLVGAWTEQTVGCDEVCEYLPAFGVTNDSAN